MAPLTPAVCDPRAPNTHPSPLPLPPHQGLVKTESWQHRKIMTEKDRERLGQKQGGRRQENYRDPENRTAREGDRKKWAGASQKGDRDSEGCRPKEARGQKEQTRATC